MRRLIIAVLLALTLVAGGLPAAPAQAETANWDLACFDNCLIHVYYAIDTNSLQVESFTVVNGGDRPTYMWIAEDGVIIFDMRVAGGETVTQPISNFKFRRIPATDHDDPDSVRYPQGVSMGAGYPAY